MNEEWKDIKGYEGLYQISSLGRVYTFKRNKLMTPVKDRKGYLRIKLRVNTCAKSLSVHRLVAEVFIPNPEDKPQVNHIDEDKTNNMVYNLEWVTGKENCNHGTKIQRTIDTVSKPILHITDGIINEYKNAVLASELTGMSTSGIRAQCYAEKITNKNNYFIYKNNSIPKYYYEYAFENKTTYTITAMSEYLGINRNTVTKRIKSGLIKRKVVYLCDQES